MYFSGAGDVQGKSQVFPRTYQIQVSVMQLFEFNLHQNALFVVPGKKKPKTKLKAFTPLILISGCLYTTFLFALIYSPPRFSFPGFRCVCSSCV